QAEWALGNVAGDSPKCRDLVLNNNAMTPLLAQLNENAVLSMLRTATWTLSTFCRGKPQPNFEQSRPSLSSLEKLIHSTDEVILTDACWALSYISDGTNNEIQAVIEVGVCPRLMSLLMYPSPNVLIPALRTVGNIVTGDDVQTQENLKRNNNGALPYLLHLLTNVYNKKDACWTISSMELLANAEFDIKKEAMQPLAVHMNKSNRCRYLVNQGCIKPLCDLLNCSDAKIIVVALEGLENILTKDPGNTGSINIYAKFIDEAEGLEKIETHDNNEIYDKVIKILNSYWVEEDEENVAPGVAPAPICIRESRSFGNVPSGGFNSG
ncbi:hypothetical protein SELMODRAFT_87307, partial [Selaginella moellendorffii]